MFTVKYKNAFIHGYFDNQRCRIQWPDKSEIIPAKTLLAAKREITKRLKESKTCQEHVWGPVETARFTGNPHRKCTLCGFVSLDLDDNED